MLGVSIGALAQQSGLRPSTIRYYESAGLMPRPARESGQRRYGPEAAARLRIIGLARAAGFTIAEARTFLTASGDGRTPAARWRALAQLKIAEIEAQTARLAQMRSLLESSFHCGCLRIEDCERWLMGKLPPTTARARTPSRAGRR